MASAPSEKWSRQVDDPHPTLFRMQGGLPPTSASLGRAGNEYMYTDRKRLAFMLRRIFVALASDGVPDKVQIAFYTEVGCPEDCVEWIWPGEPPSRPPWPAPG